MEMDLGRIAPTFTPSPARIRVRFGKVASVQADRSITVTIGGDTTQVAGIPYLGRMIPRPGAVVVLLTDGADLFAVDHVAAGDGALAPRVSRSTAQSIPDSTDTAITFDGDNSDAWGAWVVGEPTRVYAPVSGRYMAVATVHFAGNATGVRAAWIEKDGTSTLARVQHISASAGLPTWLNVTTPPFDMTAGTDYVRLIVRQTSGGALDVNNSSTFSPALGLIYLGP